MLETSNSGKREPMAGNAAVASMGPRSQAKRTNATKSAPIFVLVTCMESRLPNVGLCCSGSDKMRRRGRREPYRENGAAAPPPLPKHRCQYQASLCRPTTWRCWKLRWLPLSYRVHDTGAPTQRNAAPSADRIARILQRTAIPHTRTNCSSPQGRSPFGAARERSHRSA